MNVMKGKASGNPKGCDIVSMAIGQFQVECDCSAKKCPQDGDVLSYAVINSQ